MELQKALKAIEKWYIGIDHYYILGIEEDVPIDCLNSEEYFDPCPPEFEGLAARQCNYISGYYGDVYFKVKDGQWIHTKYEA